MNEQAMTQPSVKTRRKFDETFKRESVNNWLASRKSAAVTAQELGINCNRLYAWKQRFAPAAAGGKAAAGAPAGSVADLQAQLRRPQISFNKRCGEVIHNLAPLRITVTLRSVMHHCRRGIRWDSGCPLKK
jgi:transposase-like protein